MDDIQVLRRELRKKEMALIARKIKIEELEDGIVKEVSAKKLLWGLIQKILRI